MCSSGGCCASQCGGSLSTCCWSSKIITAYILKGWQNVKQRPAVCWMIVLERVPWCHVQCCCVCPPPSPASVPASMMWCSSERISACSLSTLPGLCCTVALCSSLSTVFYLAGELPLFFIITPHFQLRYHCPHASPPPPSCYRLLDICERLIRNDPRPLPPSWH